MHAVIAVESLRINVQIILGFLKASGRFGRTTALTGSRILFFFKVEFSLHKERETTPIINR